MSKNKEGYCHICGAYGSLSFEHIPPKKCFNNTRIESFLLFKDERNISQKGVGDYTLCKTCNNNTGAYYGNDYKDFIVKSFDVYEQILPGAKIIKYSAEIYPLRVFKQIVTIFCSYCPSGFFRKEYPSITRYLLSKEERCFPDDIRIFAFFPLFEDGLIIRTSGLISKMYFDNDGNSHNYNLSEFIFPPLGFFLTTGKAKIPNMYDLTFFNNFNYEDKIEIHFDIPFYPIVGWFPGDYRNKAEIYEANAQFNTGPVAGSPTSISMREFVNYKNRRKS